MKRSFQEENGYGSAQVKRQRRPDAFDQRHHNKHSVVHTANANQANNSSSASAVRLLANEKETDPHRLAQRQKQIDYGKNTLGYDRYCALVPRHQRRKNVHPMTPDKTARVSKKIFDGMVSRWRRALHDYDPPEVHDKSLTNDEVAKTVSAQGVASTYQSQAAMNVAVAVTLSTATGKLEENSTSDKDAQVTTDTAKNMQTTEPPTRSIFDNFEEGEFEDDDEDDDLL